MLNGKMYFMCAGRHEISVKYADVDVRGSPFYPEVYDPDEVKVVAIPDTIILGQAVAFDGKVLSYQIDFVGASAASDWV